MATTTKPSYITYIGMLLWTAHVSKVNASSLVLKDSSQAKNTNGIKLYMFNWYTLPEMQKKFFCIFNNWKQAL